MDVKKVYRKMVVLVKYFKMCASFFCKFFFSVMQICAFIKTSAASYMDGLLFCFLFHLCPVWNANNLSFSHNFCEGGNATVCALRVFSKPIVG